MKLTRIIITSKTVCRETHFINRITRETFTEPARPHHRFFIIRHFDDGTTSTVYTDSDGEGLFSTAKDGSEYQITGTCQYSVEDKTAKDAKRWFRARLKEELASTGAKLEFDLDYE